MTLARINFARAINDRYTPRAENEKFTSSLASDIGGEVLAEINVDLRSKIKNFILMGIKVKFKKILLLLGMLVPICLLANNNLTGAGSTFIDPVLSQWTEAYAKQTGIQVNYQPIGSGGGIQQLTNKTVNFAASDMPLDVSVLRQKHWKQFPMIMGGIVMVVNIGGIQANQLVLDGSTLANIYLGKITYWDDPAIHALNPKLHLPNKRIIVVHRADGSGTTFNFTHYLSQVSATFKDQVGSATLVSWPGLSLGAKENAGVAAQVINLENSIGYVEYAFALQNKMITAAMKNAAGNIVTPATAAFAQAAQTAQWTANDGFNLVLTNQAGKDTWPIVATTFILLPEKTTDNQFIYNQSIQFFQWVYQHGNAMATTLDYVAIPPDVVQLIEHEW